MALITINIVSIARDTKRRERVGRGGEAGIQVFGWQLKHLFEERRETQARGVHLPTFNTSHQKTVTN